MSLSQNEYEKALERAHSEGLQIAAHGWRKVDGRTVIGVTSHSQPNQVHMVTVEDLALSCSCPAGQHGHYCKHRALVRQHLIERRYLQSDARIATAERQLHQVACELVFIEQERKLPIPDTRPVISIFK